MSSALHHRYPIPEKQFLKLKEAARTKKVAKAGATIAKDKGKKKEMPQAVPEVAAPGVRFPPLHFLRLTCRNNSDGWLPDCTMATGPST